MRCSEPLRTSRPVLPTTFAPAAFARAQAAPCSAVAELGVVRRFCAYSMNRAFLVSLLAAAIFPAVATSFAAEPPLEDWCLDLLRQAKEPTSIRNTAGIEHFRLIFSRAFSVPLVVRVTKAGDRVTLRSVLIRRSRAGRANQRLEQPHNVGERRKFLDAAIRGHRPRPRRHLLGHRGISRRRHLPCRHALERLLQREGVAAHRLRRTRESPFQTLTTQASTSLNESPRWCHALLAGRITEIIAVLFETLGVKPLGWQTKPKAPRPITQPM